jgi:hypothetical protein
MNFSLAFLWILGGLAAAALFTRLAFAANERTAKAPWVDFFVSLFTLAPWVAGWLLDRWSGVAAAVLAQIVFLHVFCAVDRALRGKPGPTLEGAQARVLGWWRNQLCLLVQTPAIPVFWMIRLAEIVLYPPIAWLGKLPTYKSSEWVNLSRHKFDGLVGHDLLWCWYCDWMTGLWSLGGDMLRNIESFWCPIRFCDDCKCRNACTDFPDLAKWARADGNVADAVRVFDEHYDGKRKNSWWGHPDRRT